jgi:ribosomal protein S27AE
VKECAKCFTLKNESDFPKHRFGLSSTCRECTVRAKERLKAESKSKSGTNTLDLLVSPRREPQKRFEGAIHKRCPECNANIFVCKTDSRHTCWKCDSVLKIGEALRDTSHHKGGIILEAVR